MNNLFASLRIALRDIRLGEMFSEAVFAPVVEGYIPYLELKLQSAQSQDKQKFESLLREWNEFVHGDGKKRMQVDVSRFLRTNAKRKGISESDLPEIESDMVESFYEISQEKSLMDSTMATRGVDGFDKFWKQILHNLSMRSIRDFSRHTVGHGFGKRQIEIPDQEDASSEEGTELDSRIMREIRQDLDSYVKRELEGDKIGMMVYNEWMSLAELVGANGMNFDNDVAVPLGKKLEGMGIPSSRTTITNRWVEIRRAILRFFEKELGKRVSDRTKRSLVRVSSDLACEYYRRMVAVWVIGR